MANGTDPEKRYVTNKELKEEIGKLPTRWEVRFLILAAFLGSQFVPNITPAGAAIKTAARAVTGL